MYVRLAAPWVDAAGMPHRRGEVVDIDAITLAQLEEAGIVTDPSKDQADWIGPTDEGTKTTEASWIGPTDEETKVTEASWIGPTDEGTKTTEASWIGPTDEDTSTEV